MNPEQLTHAPWWSGGVTCVLCGYKWVGVWPKEANTVALECPMCGSQTGMPEPPSEE